MYGDGIPSPSHNGDHYAPTHHGMMMMLPPREGESGECRPGLIDQHFRNNAVWAAELCRTPVYAAAALLLCGSIILECLTHKILGDLNLLQSVGATVVILLGSYAAIAILYSWRRLGQAAAATLETDKPPGLPTDCCTESQSTIAGTTVCQDPAAASLTELPPHAAAAAAEQQNVWSQPPAAVVDSNRPSIEEALSALLLDENAMSCLLAAHPSLPENLEAMLLPPARQSPPPQQQQQQLNALAPPFLPAAAASLPPSADSAEAPPGGAASPPPSEDSEIAALFHAPIVELFRFFSTPQGAAALPFFYDKMVELSGTFPPSVVADLLRFPVKAAQPCPAATVALCRALLRVGPSERNLSTMQIALVCWSVSRSHQTFQRSGGLPISHREWEALAHQVMASMTEEAMEKAQDFQPLSIANLSWSFGKMNFQSGTRLLVRLAAVAAQQLRHFNAQNIANTYWALGTLEIQNTALTPRARGVSVELCGTLCEKMSTFNSQALANFVWACARLGWCPSTVLTEAASEAAARVNEFKPQELANFMWAVAKLDAGSVAGTTVAIFADRAAELIQHFNSQEVSNAYWAIATLDMRGTRLTPHSVSSSSAALAKSSSTARSCEPSEVEDFGTQESIVLMPSSSGEAPADHLASRVISPDTYEELDLIQQQQQPKTSRQSAGHTAALLRTDSYHHHLDHPLVRTLSMKLREFNPQAIANFLWACAKLQWHVVALIEDSHPLVLRNANIFRPQNIANVLWAHAKLKVRHPGILRTLTHVAAMRLRDFNTQELANIYWALGTLDCRESALTPALPEDPTNSKLLTVVSQKMESFKPQELSNMVWGFARLRWRPVSLLEKACSVAKNQVGGFKPQEVGNLVWALAKLDFPAEELIRLLASRAAHTLTSFTTQNLANMYWALGYFNICNTPLDADDTARPELTRRLTRFVNAFNEQEFCNFVIAISKLQWNAPTILNAVKERVHSNSFRKHEVSGLLTAFRRLNQPDMVEFLQESKTAEV